MPLLCGISRKGDYIFGSMTVYFTLQPAILAAISKKSWKKFVDHLPIKHLKTHLELQTEIAKWQTRISEQDHPYIKSLFEERLHKLETELQEVKVFFSMGESAPQFILALSILMKNHSLKEWIMALDPSQDPWAILTLIQVGTSLVSTMTSVTGIYTDMPLNGETPVRSLGYKFGKILPLVFLEATPRLYTLSTVYSQANFYDQDSHTFKWANCLFFTLLTYVIFTLYYFCYQGLFKYLRKQDRYLTKNMSFLGFFTSLISPSMVGSYSSNLFILSSTLSAFYYTLMLGIIWVSTIYLPIVFDPSTIEDLQMHCIVLTPVVTLSIIISLVKHRIYLKKNMNIVLQPLIKDGDEANIKKLVKKAGSDIVHAKLQNGLLPVNYAASCSGSTDDQAGQALQLFVTKQQAWGIDFNIPNENGWNALMNSAVHGKVGNAQLLLAKSDDFKLELNAVNKFGKSALRLACQAENPQVILPFLEVAKAKGIDVNRKDNHGRTAFFKACMQTSEDNKMERVEIMLAFAKDLEMDLTSGFEKLIPEMRSQLRVKFPTLVPTEETFIF